MKTTRETSLFNNSVAEYLEEMLSAVNHNARREIMDMMPCTVKEMVEETGLPQPQVSSFLRILNDYNIVKWERKGQSVVYSVDDDFLYNLDQLLMVGENFTKHG